MKRLGWTMALLLGGPLGVSAQVTVTSPGSGATTVGPADDYATRSFQDPWDMSQHSDLGWFTFGSDSPPVNLANISVSSGIFSATPTNSDPNFWLLDSFVPGSAELGRIGRNFPIDASKYQVLVLRMRVSERPGPGQAMQILWSNNTIYPSQPGGGFRTSNGVLTYEGWNIYVVDLVALGTASPPGWSGSVDALRIDPTQFQVAQIQLDWARLVPLDNANLQRTIQWTGAASVDVFLDNDTNVGNGTLGQIGRGVSGGSFPFYVGGLAPGDYYVAMRDAGTADPLAYSPGFYRVLGAPTLTISSPSEEGSDDDFATVQLGDPWDMDSTSDVDRVTGVTSLSAGTISGVDEAGDSLGTVNVIQGTSSPAASVGDPVLYWLWSTSRGLNYRIDTDRYRVLTFEEHLPGARNVLNGSIARVVWKISDESVENVSQDIIINHRTGANVFARIIADMKTLELETSPGGSPSTSGWINGGGSPPGVNNFRIDPHEFASATSFAYRRVKLAAFERAGATYQINWDFTNPSSLSTTLKLVADLDRAGCNGLTVATGLNPTAGSYDWTLPGSFNDGEARYICAQVLFGATVVNQVYSRWPVVREVGYTEPLPRLVPDRTSLRFGGVSSSGNLSSVTPSQEVVVTQVGAGSVAWTASSNKSWLQVTPTSLSGTDVLTVGIDALWGGFPANAALHGTVTISSMDASNSPQYVEVDLTVKAPGSSSAPFGVFETPLNGSTGVTGALPVTGWALDDVGVQTIKLYRNPVPGEPAGSNGKVYIGDASLVAGARPDVEAIYADSMPRSHLAGWGYQLLTNFLPNGTTPGTVGGNGTFTLHIYASDFDGHTALIGSRTITCDNANATKPFGTIDTPAQGGDAAGNDFKNFGWALTPQPASIPTDGSTINVFVDGAFVGKPLYNLYRVDIATLFPGYANTNGAVGRFILDTTAFANGVHTIAWGVKDDLGHTEGIGSRFFSILNGTLDVLPEGSVVSVGDLGQIYGDDLGRSSRSLKGLPTAASLRVDVAPAEAVQVRLPDVLGHHRAAYLIAGDRLGRLPPGAGFDVTTGDFLWTPGSGFNGSYRFVVIERGPDGRTLVQPLDVRVHAAPGSTAP